MSVHHAAALLMCAALALRASVALGAPDERGAALIAAARAGDGAKALALLREGADAKARAPDNTTALHWAAQTGDTGLVAKLLAAGADPNAANDYGVLPLAAAALTGNAEVLHALLTGGANPDSPNADGQTALMIVARGGNVDAGRVLLDGGANANAHEEWRGQTALMWAAAQKRPAMTKLLLQRGADPNAQAPPNDFERQVSGEPRAQYRPYGGLTALLYAAREGCTECARALVAGKVDMNQPDPRGVTPLIMALANAHFDFAKYLIEAGADPNQWDWWGRTPLYMAVDLNTTPDGGRPDLPSEDRTTGVEVARLLLEKGANPNAQLKLFPPYRHVEDDRGCDRMLTIGATPLLRAAKVFDVESIDVLVTHGASVDLPNVNGLTPLMAAAGYGSVECDVRGHYLGDDVPKKSLAAVERLVAAGADVNAREDLKRGHFTESTGRTALHGAAFWGWDGVVSYLVAHGARIDAADNKGLTPLDSALGKAGGHGRGQDIQTFQHTADLLQKLCTQQSGCSLATPASVAAQAR